MGAAARFHGRRFGVALLVLLVLGAALRSYVAHQSRFLADQKREGERQRAELVVDAVLKAPADALPYAIRNLEPLRAHAVRMLQQEFERAAPGSPRRLRAAVSLAAFGDLRFEALLASAEAAPPRECGNVVAALDRDRDAAIRALERSVAQADAQRNFPFKARLSVLLLHLGAPSVARQMCTLGADPIQRTLWIDCLATWHGAIDRLVGNVADREAPSFRSGICSGIGAIAPGELTPGEIGAVVPTLVQWYRKQPDGGTHSAAGWALRQWNQTLPGLASRDDPQADVQWRVNSVGMTMLLIPAGRLPAVPRRDGALRPDAIAAFWLSDRETSRALFQKLVDDPATPAAAKPEGWTGSVLTRSPTAGHPVQSVSWFDAILFCNWLSRKEGRTPCYGQGAAADPWERNEAADGYRLPTEAEWEYACRAGAATRFASGDDEGLLERYAVLEANHAAVCGSKMPNGWGAFDLHGNVFEWCQDGCPPPKDGRRVLRGGAFDYSAGVAPAARRESNIPSYRSFTIGFRVARSNR
jgi:formylglycine-generating enzyme required for sulfatase activity